MTLVVVVNEIKRVLALLSGSDSGWLVVAPGGDIARFADVAVGDSHVRDDVVDVAAPVELHVGTATRVKIPTRYLLALGILIPPSRYLPGTCTTNQACLLRTLLVACDSWYAYPS